MVSFCVNQFVYLGVTPTSFSIRCPHMAKFGPFINLSYTTEQLLLGSFLQEGGWAVASIVTAQPQPQPQHLN